MRRVLVAFMLVLCFAVPASVLVAQEGSPDKKFEVTGDLRLRWERLANYFDFNNDGAVDTNFDGIPDSRDKFSFWPYRARVGVMGQLADNIQVVLDIQNVGSGGNEFPGKSFHFPTTQTFDGDGNTSGFRSGETSLYQAFLKFNNIWDSGVNVTMGRQEYEFGTGLILGNEDYYNGTTYDGLRASYDSKDWGLEGWYYIVNERNDLANRSFTGFGSDDTNMLGAVGTYHVGGSMRSEVNGYLVSYKDGSEANFKPGWLTLGGHWWRTVKSKDDVEANPWDWNIEVAVQSGDITPGTCSGGPDDGLSCASDSDCTAPGTCATHEQDLSGTVLDASAGYNFAHNEMVYGFHLGGIWQSGDDDTTDQDIDGWNALSPRTHGRFGGADFFGNNFGGPLFNFGGPIDSSTGFVHGVPPSGITAYHASFTSSCHDGKHVLDASIWSFKPTEDRIDVGAADKLHVKDFGKEFDVDYAYAYSKNVTLSLGFAYLKPTDDFGLLLGFPDPDKPGAGMDDPVTRLTAAARVKF